MLHTSSTYRRVRVAYVLWFSYNTLCSLLKKIKDYLMQYGKCVLLDVATDNFMYY